MSSLTTFSPGFDAWARLAGYFVDKQSTGIEVANSGGEIRFEISQDNENFSLTRGERGEDARFVLSSGSIEHIEKYLTVELAAEIRDKRDFPQLDIPWHLEDVADGYVIERLSESQLVLRDRHGASVVFFDHGTPHPIVEFSHYASASLDTIRAACLCADGKPLFDAESR